MECLAGSQFSDLLGGVASPELARYIDAHVDICETCHQLMLDLVRAVSYSATGGSRPRTAAREVQRPRLGGNPASVSHRYRLLGLLGEGGMGRVYRALDRLSGTEVALKQVLIAPSLGRQSAALSETLLASEPVTPGAHDPLDGGTLPGDLIEGGQDARAMAASLGILAEEFRTLAGLRHPNVVSVLDYGLDAAGQPFYTMELLADAQPLLQFAHGRPASQQLELLIQILHALAYLHRRGIVHRDLTPSNVLVVNGPQGPVVKVVDFGLAIETERGEAASLAGTLLYMAPELFRGEAASESSDLYAVGAMAYQILADRYPFEAQRGAAQLLRQVLGESPDLSPLMPAMRPVIGRALSKDPADRQPDAVTLLRELAAAADISLKNEPVAARDSYLLAARFVGRKQELGQLQMALQAAQRGCGAAWLISGESGVGKSRLLEELRSSALISGVLSARGQAVPGGTAYHLWQEVLKLLALQVPLSDLEAGVIATILPDLPRLLERELLAPQELDAPSARLRLLHVVGEVLERLPETALVLLEDLQWADGASLTLLSHLTTSASARRLLVIATCRSEESPALPESLPQLRKLPLLRLARPDMEALCESMLGRAGQDPTLVDLIARETEGNTYFMVEVVRALAAESGSLADIGRSGLPQRVAAGGIEEVLKRRLSWVPMELRPLLDLAAVAGRQIDLPLMCQLMPQAEVQLRELADLGIIELYIQRWRFCHDKLRDRVCDTVSPSEKKRLHGRIAQGLADVYPGDTSQAALAALHYREAGQPAPAAHCYRLAANEAMRRGAPADALALFEQARLLHQQVAVSRVEQVQVWRGLTEARFALGRHGETEAALRQLCMLAGRPLPTHALGLWSQVARLCATLLASRLGLRQKAPPPGTAERKILGELLIAFGLGELFVWTDQAEMGLLCGLWEMCLEDQLATEPHRTYHSSGLFFILSHTPLRGLCQRYLAQLEGRVASGTQAEINYCRFRALVEINNSNFHPASKYAAQAVALARKHKDDLALLHSLLQLQLAAAGLYDFPQMLAVGREMEPLAVRAENPRYLTLAYMGQGGALLNLGDIAAAALALDKARAHLPQELGPIPESVTLGLAAVCALHLKQFARAEELADQALHAVQRARWNLAQLRYPLTGVLEVYLREDQSEHATAKIESALTRLHQIARLFVHAVSADELFHGIYFWRYGQPRRALRAFRRSIAVAERLSLGFEKATAQYWLGCFAQTPAGRRLVPEGAAPHLRAAIATFADVGSALLLQNARQALQSSP